jgi:hypothetical protein
LEAKERSVTVNKSNHSLLVSGRSSRVGSRRDVRHAFSKEQVAEVTSGYKSDNPDVEEVPEDAFRARMSDPLLLVYFLRGFETIEKKKVEFRKGIVLPALALHFPGVRDPDAPKRLIRYRLNRIGQAELFGPEIEEEDSIVDDPDADY